MTSLRSGLEVSFVNQPRHRHRHRPRAPAKPNRQQTRNGTRKARPKADSTAGQSTTRSAQIDLAARIRFRQLSSAHELATGDNADTLRQKRRWIQKEFEAGRIDGKATRELQDLYSKRNMGKLEHHRTMAESLSDTAKGAKKRIEQVFGYQAAANHSADHTSDTHNSPHYTSSNRTSPHDTEDYDAAARRNAQALGLELADYSTGGQGNSADVGNAHEEEEVAFKMEEDVHG